MDNLRLDETDSEYIIWMLKEILRYLKEKQVNLQ
jgi:hypothetical protein